MRAVLWSALLLGLVAAAAAAAGTNPKPAIVNGAAAARGRFPYMVSLRNASNPIQPVCGGTLIHPWVVLTAAHCVRDTWTGENRPLDFFKPIVRIGGYTRNADAPTEYQERRVKWTAVHPKFSTGFTDPLTKDHANYDAALLFLSEPSTKATVKLIGPTYKPALPAPVGSTVTVVGWGRTVAVGPDTQRDVPLQLLHQALLSLQECQALEGEGKFRDKDNAPHYVDYNFTTNTMICAARRSQPVGVFCGGDSGGPLLVAGAAARQDCQIGIVSWGPYPCDEPTGVYTDVGMVFKWVEETVFRWTGDRLQPWTPPPITGGMLADSNGLGFNGKPFTYSGEAGKAVDIASNAGLKPLGWFLNGVLTNGSAPGTQALGYVAWNFGARVAAQIGRHGHMVVHLNNQPLWQGTKRDLGKLVTIDYAGHKCGRAGCEARKVETTVRSAPNRPWIKIAITQPWLKPTTAGAQGSFAPYLEVSVTLYDKPKQPLTGYLGQTVAP